MEEHDSKIRQRSASVCYNSIQVFNSNFQFKFQIEIEVKIQHAELAQVYYINYQLSIIDEYDQYESLRLRRIQYGKRAKDVIGSVRF